MAWVRTAIAMMGFGFILVKFSIFLRQISAVTGEILTLHHPKGYSGLTGIVMVSAGILT